MKLVTAVFTRFERDLRALLMEETMKLLSRILRTGSSSTMVQRQRKILCTSMEWAKEYYERKKLTLIDSCSDRYTYVDYH